ncbi:hypothetical protein Phab24_id091 [Acinetobacter phage Phab24]|nr:hypothetical protein Phab24_id091 [Acinetobacter phage Phab24]
MEIMWIILSIMFGIVATIFVHDFINNDGKSKSKKSPITFVRTRGLESLKAEYKANYLWACKTFGVSHSVFTDTSETEYGGRYWLYKHVVRIGDSYGGKYLYPHNLPFPKTQISETGLCFDKEAPTWVYSFMVEFNEIVNKVRDFHNSEDIKLYIKYGVSYKCLMRNIIGD